VTTKKIKLSTLMDEPIEGVSAIAQHSSGAEPETLVRIVTTAPGDPVAAIRETLATLADGKMVLFCDLPVLETAEGGATELRYSFYLADMAAKADAKAAGAVYLGYEP
jgi:hypothetical protein